MALLLVRIAKNMGRVTRTSVIYPTEETGPILSQLFSQSTVDAGIRCRTA